MWDAYVVTLKYWPKVDIVSLAGFSVLVFLGQWQKTQGKIQNLIVVVSASDSRSKPLIHVVSPEILGSAGESTLRHRLQLQISMVPRAPHQHHILVCMLYFLRTDLCISSILFCGVYRGTSIGVSHRTITQEAWNIDRNRSDL